jgi:hypothetical protein
MVQVVLQVLLVNQVLQTIQVVVGLVLLEIQVVVEGIMIRLVEEGNQAVQVVVGLVLLEIQVVVEEIMLRLVEEGNKLFKLFKIRMIMIYYNISIS